MVEHVGQVAPYLVPLVRVEDEVRTVDLVSGPHRDPHRKAVVGENGNLFRKNAL